MGRTRKIRGGGLPAFKNAKPANLTKLSKMNARNFIHRVCTRDLPNYLDLFKMERKKGCVNNVCPQEMKHNHIQWEASERFFKEQCATAERLMSVRNIPAAANLDPSYIKNTADRLIQDMPALVAAKSSYANVVKGTRPAATTPITKAVVTAPARTAARTPATAATTKPVVTAPARTAARTAVPAPTTKPVVTAPARTAATAPTTKAVPATSATTKVVPATAATTKIVPAATTTATATPPSIMHQSIQEIKQNLQAVSQVLETMTKTGGATRRRRRRRN